MLPGIAKAADKKDDIESNAAGMAGIDEKDAKAIARAKQAIALRAVKSSNDSTTVDKMFFPEDESLKMPPLVS